MRHSLNSALYKPYGEEIPGPKIFKDCPQECKVYFKFTFVRNPWDRLVSTFFDKTKHVIGTQWELPQYAKYEHYTFKEFVRDLSDQILSERHVRTQISLLGSMKNVDFIGKFESLQEDFERVCSRIGISCEELPHHNKMKHKSYWEYYDDETRALVSRMYKQDIDCFEYQFGETGVE